MVNTVLTWLSWGSRLLMALSCLGVTQLNLNAQTFTEDDNGNMVGLVSNYTTSDGAVHDMVDVWFATSQTAPAALTKTAAVVPLTLNLVVPSTDNTLAAASASVPAATAASLTTQVGGLVDAMAAFDGAAGAAQPGAGSLLSVKPEPQASLTVSGGITGMVDALKQFDANGQPLIGGKLLSAASLTALETKPRKPDVDILTSGK